MSRSPVVHLPVVHLIAAARPNYMKVGPLYQALARLGGCRPVLVDAGQHYDPEMAESFRQELGLPEPEARLGVGSGSHAEQTAAALVAYERLCLADPPSWVVVAGDVNATLACALAAKKLQLPVAHLEAGLRSGDRSMPEELNRVVVDAIADLLWTPSADADANLRAEGIPGERIERVGNVMIDAYELLRERIEAARTAERLGLEAGAYGVVTLHRPTNVDQAERLTGLLDALARVATELPLVFPVHPRTRRRLEQLGLGERLASIRGLRTTEPLGYVAFMSLVSASRVVITDSGGLQEETTYLGIPCLTLRASTERPITVSQGTNRLVEADELLGQVGLILAGDWPRGSRPELWDGHAAERAAASLAGRLEGRDPGAGSRATFGIIVTAERHPVRFFQ
jgi:UDP-N-acetylglucosamine 2-epimerase (non-hydrolysing)